MVITIRKGANLMGIKDKESSGLSGQLSTKDYSMDFFLIRRSSRSEERVSHLSHVEF